jgi:ABC-type sugar transport system ATPase subunit
VPVDATGGHRHRPFRARRGRTRTEVSVVGTDQSIVDNDNAERAGGMDPAPVPSVALEAEGLAKSYGATRAVVSASVRLSAGRIVGMVGENGSGKSTFVKLLSGVARPDAGTITVGGIERRGLRSPGEARAAGIATIFQEILVCPAQSVLDNVFLGEDGLVAAREDEGARRERCATVLERLSGRAMDLDAPVETLTIAEQQLVTIARALVRDPRILILDESTSALDVSDRDRLFALCRELRDEGRALLFITHRLEELLALADEILVIRDGTTIAAPRTGGVSRDEILAAMTRQGPSPALPARPRETIVSGEAAAVPVLTAEALDIGAGAIDLDVAAGSIIGLAGLEGHGQEAFLKALAGLQPPVSGQVLSREHGVVRSIASLHDAARSRIYYLPRNRARAGIFPPLSILDNFGMPTLGRSSRVGVLSTRRLRRRFVRWQDELRIKAAGSSVPITTLSGGNQQKVLIARWLAADPRVLLLDDPTRGVDLPTKDELHELLRREADAGMAVVIVSTEIEELEGLCDRVLVFHEQRVSARLAGSALTRDALLRAMFDQAA